LQHFVEQRRASREDLRVQACKHGLDPATTAGVLAREDLAHLDDEGEVVVAYPFSASGRGFARRPSAPPMRIS